MPPERLLSRVIGGPGNPTPRLRPRRSHGPLRASVAALVLLGAATVAGFGLTVVAPAAQTVAGAATHDSWTAYVANTDGTVTPIDTATDRSGPLIHAGASTGDGAAIAITPDGRTAYYVDTDGNTVVPIDTATGTVEPAVTLPAGTYPDAIAITPDGRTAYVTGYDNTVTPIDTTTDVAGSPVGLGSACFESYGIAIAPDGTTAYVVCPSSPGLVIPVDLTTTPATAGPGSDVGDVSYGIAITPNGTRAYLADESNNEVTVVSLPHGITGPRIGVGQGPAQVAITPDGRTAFVTNSGNGGMGGTLGTVSPIDLATDTAGLDGQLGDSHRHHHREGRHSHLGPLGPVRRGGHPRPGPDGLVGRRAGRTG
jgi:DNA-binding beta-propeller fold protein YncE